MKIMANEVGTEDLFKAHENFPRRLFKTLDGRLVDRTLSPVTIEEKCRDTIHAMKDGIMPMPLKWWGVETEGDKDYVYSQGFVDICSMLTLYDAKVLLGKDFPEPKLPKSYQGSPIANLIEEIKVRALLAAASHAITWDPESGHNAYYIAGFKKSRIGEKARFQ